MRHNATILGQRVRCAERPDRTALWFCADSQKACMFIAVHQVQKLSRPTSLGMRIVSTPFEIGCFPIHLPEPLCFHVGGLYGGILVFLLEIIPKDDEF